MAFKFRTTYDENGNTVHHGTCGHEYPGSGKRGRPYTECPKCRKADAAPKAKRASKKASKKAAEALV